MTIPIIFAVVTVGIFILELWTGIALAGWSAHYAYVSRETHPRRYWFAMVVQLAAVSAMAAMAWAFRNGIH
ncbi:hypothetical protein [Stieleria varia]|uniref:Uncharacterized protein n=1 Tax=Stieleria varia TaxID=2528005 RepID=A0A5C6AYE1_9BACT|nr:hypothetical protein [Stieleria varia]TWU04497.1 hypothetical protein Pla52n_25380 [Stieleria varia]